MIFHSTADGDREIVVGGKVYKVPAGGECELPDHLGYVAETRGYTWLMPGAAPGTDAPKAAVADAVPPRPAPHVLRMAAEERAEKAAAAEATGQIEREEEGDDEDEAAGEAAKDEAEQAAEVEQTVVALRDRVRKIRGLPKSQQG